ncbi:MAG: hypothetical protein GY953_31500 [bacterium]|nr:hypothetical protein [bacterium]
MKTTYEARGWIADCEIDEYENGCLLEGGICKSGGEVFSGTTPEEAIRSFADFVCSEAGDEVDVDPENPNRVTLQRMETDKAYAPTDAEVEAWKSGKLRLWLVTYSATFRRVTREDVDLSGVLDTI